MNTRLLLFIALVFSVSLFTSPVEAAGSFSYTAIDPSACTTAGTSCSASQACVMADTAVGRVPTCMPTGAVNNVNYYDNADCVKSCSVACTTNQYAYTETYYCDPGNVCPVGNSCTTSSGTYGICGTDGQCYASGRGGGTGSGAPSGGNTPPGTGTGGNTPPGTGPSQSGGQTVTLVNPLGAGATLNSFLQSILQIVIQIGTVVIILMIIYVGWLFVMARGEPGKITEARQALLWTVIGALVLLGAQAIALGIQNTVNALSQGH